MARIHNSGDDMTVTARHRHMLLVADRTRKIDVIAAIVDVVMSEGATAAEVEQAFRDGSAQSYLIANDDKLSIVLGIKEMLAAVGEANMTPDQNRQALASLSKE
jgi:hypothetical protein